MLIFAGKNKQRSTKISSGNRGSGRWGYSATVHISIPHPNFPLSGETLYHVVQI